MRTLALAPVLLVGATALVARPGSLPTPPALPALLAERSCKPSGPLRLEVAPTRRSDGRVELALELEPLREARRLTWGLDLPEGVSLLGGEARGVASTQRASITRSTLTLDVPEGIAQGVLRVRAEGVFLGSDETGARFEEPVVVERRIRWGARPELGRPVSLIDRATGRLVERVDVPSRHRRGR